MNKFGLIDIFTKLSQDKNTIKLLTNTVNTLFNKNSSADKNAQPHTVKNIENKKPKYSQEVILSLLKRHDELSKQIDLNLKNEPPNE